MNELFERALTFTGDGLYRYTLEEGILLFANQGFVKILELGSDPQQAIGQPLHQLFTYLEPKGTIRARLRKFGEVHGQLYTFRTLRGNERWVIHDAFIARDESGREVVEAIIKDVTAVKKLEEEHIKTQKLESLGILAGGIAHDFNNLLTIILGNISALSSFIPPDMEKVHHMIAAVEKATLRGQHLTQQLLTFSRGGAPAKKLCNVETVIRDAATFTAQGSRVRIDFLFEEGLPLVEIDSGQIGQVVQNLVMNALQAMPGGGVVCVSAKRISLDSRSPYPLGAGDYVCISVADCGTGISREIISRIFEPYFTTKTGGSGLGLAVSSSIVSRHGGHLTVSSEVGKGSIFTFFLPASPAQAAEIAQKTSTEKKVCSGRILIMDDETAIRELAVIILGNAGYEVLPAANAPEALETFRQAIEADRRFDAVILDLTIPGGPGGREVVNDMLKMHPGIRAIACSGYSNDAVMANPADFGFVASLAKPFMANDVLRVIREVLP